VCEAIASENYEHRVCIDEAGLGMYASVYVCVCMCMYMYACVCMGCPTTISMLLYSKKGYVCMKWHQCVLDDVEVVCDASCRSTYSRVLLANVIQSFSSNS